MSIDTSQQAAKSLRSCCRVRLADSVYLHPLLHTLRWHAGTPKTACSQLLKARLSPVAWGQSACTLPESPLHPISAVVEWRLKYPGRLFGLQPQKKPL